MDDDTDDSPKAAGVPPSPEIGKDKPNDPGVTFDELVDRLVALPLSKQDSKFAAVFLCLYRKFATPARLLSAVITRFDRMEASPVALLTRLADQLRVLNITAQWLSEYPGDFARPKTRRRLRDFIAALENNKVFAFAAKEMNSFLESFVDDADTGWAFDDDDDKSENVETFLDTSVQSSPATLVAKTSIDSLNNMSSLDLSEENPEFSSENSTTSGASSVYRAGNISSQSFLTLMTVETAQQLAQGLELIPRTILSKSQWRLFMEIPEEEFAREVTRIDWIMYSSFRPRELVRHASMSREEKEKAKGLENVNRMIKEFNHLAFFVASMILLRDKPSHRAKAMEKFMNISGVSTSQLTTVLPPIWLT
jgi:hypothetical protein